MIAWPGRSARFTASVAATMKQTSGSLNLESGVGTQIEIASGSRQPRHVGRRLEPAARERLPQLRVGDVLDVRVTGVEAVHHALADVEAEDAVARLGQLHGQRKADVAQPDDAEQRLAALAPSRSASCTMSIGSLS